MAACDKEDRRAMAHRDAAALVWSQDMRACGFASSSHGFLSLCPLPSVPQKWYILLSLTCLLTKHDRYQSSSIQQCRRYSLYTPDFEHHSLHLRSSYRNKYQPSPSHIKHIAKLDSIETPVWYRNLPAQPTTPPNIFGPPMSATVHHVGVPPLEIPSPTASETSLSTRQGEQDERPTAMVPRRITRANRSPSRPLLRTAFRNFSGVATVIVGEAGNKTRPQTQYLVHKELLTAASPFFAAALNSTFAEGMEQTVRLPEEKPESFEWFLQWLYTGTLTTQPTASSGPVHPRALAGNAAFSPMTATTPSNTAFHHPGAFDIHLDGDLRNAAGSPKYFLLLDLYALSDRLLTTPLSNHILSTIARLSESTNSVPTPSDTYILYDSIRDTSPLRALVLDLFAYKKTDKLLETHKDDWHPLFLRQLVVKLKRPGPEAIERHSLASWRPRSWSTSKACVGCCEILKPNVSADKCVLCEKAFCGECLRRHAGENLGGGGGMGHDGSGCKPWMGRGLCLRYHEHEDGVGCG